MGRMDRPGFLPEATVSGAFIFEPKLVFWQCSQNLKNTVKPGEVAAGLPSAFSPAVPQGQPLTAQTPGAGNCAEQ